MAKRIYETAAGKSLSAWVILKGSRVVAVVRAHYGNSGHVTVEVTQREAAYLRCEAAQAKLLKRALRSREAAYNQWALQRASAGGYGYDKTTAALAGLWIDGHKLTNHCGARIKSPKSNGGLWPEGSKARRGYRFANYVNKQDGSPAGYSDCYRQSGLDYLRDLGYEIVEAL